MGEKYTEDGSSGGRMRKNLEKRDQCSWLDHHRPFDNFNTLNARLRWFVLLKRPRRYFFLFGFCGYQSSAFIFLLNIDWYKICV